MAMSLVLCFYFSNWTIWLCRSALFFFGKLPSVQNTVFHCLNLVATYPTAFRRWKHRNIGPGPQCLDAIGFFNGATTLNAGGIGAVLYIGNDLFYSIRLGCGHNTNSRAELLALFGLLYVSHDMGLPEIRVHGDSMMVIDWAKGKSKLNVTNLEHWCNRTADLVHGFSSFGCHESLWQT